MCLIILEQVYIVYPIVMVWTLYSLPNYFMEIYIDSVSPENLNEIQSKKTKQKKQL